MPGVAAVFTADDLGHPAAGPERQRGGRVGSSRARSVREILARERVRYVGESFALVVAETLGRRRMRPRWSSRRRAAARRHRRRGGGGRRCAAAVARHRHQRGRTRSRTGGTSTCWQVPTSWCAAGS